MWSELQDKEKSSVSKSTIRKSVLAERDALSREEQHRAAELLRERISGHSWFLLSDILLAFVSYGSEIDTTPIIQEALHLEKKVYVPKVEGQDMVFYRITSLSELQQGYKGIREPVGDTEAFTYQAELAEKMLMLMPGAVFDRERNRIGYGKGFYDRFLADKPQLQLRTIGVCHKIQMTEGIPTEPWDIKPCQIIDV